jgi:hypothetical protein
MRAEKKSRWRRMRPRRFPPPVVGASFPLRCLAIAFGAKQVRTRELKEPGQFICSHCGFYVVIPRRTGRSVGELFQGAHIKGKQHRSYGSNFKLEP